MDAETGFLIDGKVYEVPTLDSLTLDEAELMYERCGLVQEDFVSEEGETDDERDARVAKLMRHPGFMASLIQISYQRGNPKVKPGQVHLVIGKTNQREVFSTLGEGEEEPDDIPLASTSEPNEPSNSGSLENENSTKESSASGGSDSGKGSGEQAGEVVSIGTSRSATSSTSDPETSVASGPAT